MKRFLKTFLLAGLGLALVATPAFAQGGLMLGGGLTFPKGDFENGLTTGVHAMLGLGLAGTSGGLGLRVDGSYHLNDIDAPGDPDAAANIRAVNGDLTFAFPSVGTTPYLLGGLTWASLRCRGDDCLSEDSEEDTGYNLGGGIRFGGFFVEAKYVKIGGDLDIEYLPVTLGLSF